MNTVCLLLTTAWCCGADPVPAAVPLAKSADACAATCVCCPAGDCGCQPGLLQRLFARCRKCDPCCVPCPPVTCCDQICCQPGLLQRLFARCRKCDPCCDCCVVTSPCAPGTSHGLAPAPQPMPKAEPIAPPKEEPKKLPQGENTDAKAPAAIEAAPVINPNGSIVIEPEKF
ncbi:MAG: hypothetical protein NZ700_08925 [Gemmataceae bacterium]|nr:hypothetical protein [Gemmataceae bacterium]MDW8267398.1 hypothetical protein [Gemmataceae bacterium]